MKDHRRNIVLIACLLAALPAFAQSDTAAEQLSAELERCAQISTDRSRLACYDELLRPAPRAVVAPPAPAPADDAPAREVTAAPVEAPPPVEAAEPEQRRGGLFSRRRDRDADEERETVLIVEVRTGISNLRTYTTQDGRVFDQTSTNSIRHDEPPFNATIEQASFGSYFLVPEGNRRGIRVSLRE